MSENIWTPETEIKRVSLKAEILNAKYYPLEKQMILAVRLPNGRAVSQPIPCSAYLFQGKPCTEVPAEFIDKEMEKTAELYRRSRGRKITVELDEELV
jgi:hypothetical protein